MFKRSSGVLAHVTSLPSPHGVGTMGKTDPLRSDIGIFHMPRGTGYQYVADHTISRYRSPFGDSNSSVYGSQCRRNVQNSSHTAGTCNQRRARHDLYDDGLY